MKTSLKKWIGAASNLIKHFDLTGKKKWLLDELYHIAIDLREQSD